MNKLNPIIAFLVISVISSASVAGDKYKPLREISPYATISTIPTIASTTNETGDPIVLPEDVIDKAIKTPAKDKDVELQRFQLCRKNNWRGRLIIFLQIKRWKLKNLLLIKRGNVRKSSKNARLKLKL